MIRNGSERGWWRRLVERIAPVLCGAGAGLVVLVAISIVAFLFWKGVPALNWRLLTTDPQPSLTESLSGGIRSPLGGTVLLVVLGTAMVVLPALGAATYLSEYMREDRWPTRSVRLGLEVLAGVPSVVFGMFGLAFFTMSQLSFLSSPGATAERAFGRSFVVGAIVLTLHILPFVIKVMEEAIRSVPKAYRQAAAALGMGRWATTRKVVLPAAAPGIMTGIILGMGLIAGDTAIVKLCVGDSMVMTGAEKWWLPWNWLHTALGSGSTLTSFTLYSSAAGEGNSPTKAFGAAFLLIVVVLVMNLGVEWLMRRRQAAGGAR
jgi:phosphate transport system permease protein